MKKVYILYEEKESSQFCSVKGVWSTKQTAIEHMQRLIRANKLYSQFSKVDLSEGYSESDPMYNEGIYSNYHVMEFEVYS